VLHIADPAGRVHRPVRVRDVISVKRNDQRDPQCVTQGKSERSVQGKMRMHQDGAKFAAVALPRRSPAGIHERPPLEKRMDTAIGTEDGAGSVFRQDAAGAAGKSAKYSPEAAHCRRLGDHKGLRPFDQVIAVDEHVRPLFLAYREKAITAGLAVSFREPVFYTGRHRGIFPGRQAAVGGFGG
jgi:hypothetical protein